jgi:hypothetical protein
MCVAFMSVHCFWVLDSNLDLNSNCLFVLKGNRIRKKEEDSPLKLPPFPAQSVAAAQLAKSACAPQIPSPR